MSYIFYDGEIKEESEVTLSIRSKVVNYGLGVFEGIRAYWDAEEKQLYGFMLHAHYKRFLDNAKIVNCKIDYTVEELVEITKELLIKNNCKSTTYIRPIAYKDGREIGFSLIGHENDRLAIYTSPLEKYMPHEEFHVGISSWVRISDNQLPPSTKAIAGYLNSGLASMEVIQNGFDEAILLNSNGYVCEGPGENIFIVRNGKIITPPPSDDILEGITRSVVMELAEKELKTPVIERSITRSELYRADEVFFSGTAMEVAPVVSVDRRQVADGKPGEVYKQIKDLFFGLTTGKNEKYKHWCTPIY